MALLAPGVRTSRSAPFLIYWSRRALWALLAASLSLSTVAQAHPHEWIDLRVRLMFDNEKRLTAVEQSWLFDPFFSALVLDELLADRPGRRAIARQAEALGPEMVSNLSEHAFLNEWTFDGAPIDGLNGSFVSARVTRDQFELTFSLDLDQPLDLRGGQFEYSVYDPTYYIEILHARRHLPELRGAPRGCQREIIEPDTPKDMTDFAASLDQTDASDERLGIHFAERAIIRCRG